MATERIKHGQSFNLSGTLGANDTLIGLTGDPGALILVTGAATNKGMIALYGARAASKQGATLTDTGSLANAGLLTVGSGENSAHSASLGIEGLLTNSGTLFGQAGTYGAGARIGVGSNGTLRNAGTLTLAAGGAPGSYGATLTDAGIVVNEARGVIDLAGASGDIPHGFGYSVSGGSMVVSGTLDNHGTLNLYDSSSHGIDGAGVLTINGVLQNSGTILVGDALPPYRPENSGASLAIAGNFTNSGTVVVAGYAYGLNGRSTLEVTGSLANQGQLTLQAGGIGGHYIYPGSGALLLVSGSLDNSGSLTIEGFAGGGSGSAPFFTGATIIVTGSLTNNGAMLEQQSSGIEVIGSVTNDAVLTAFGGEGFFYLQSYQGTGGVISVSGSLTNASSGTITLRGGLSQYQPSYPFLSADGTGGQLRVAGSLYNSGLVIVGGGAGGAPSGSYGIGASVSVAIDGIVRSNGTFDIQQGVLSPYGLYGTGGLVTDAGLFEETGVLSIAGGAGKAAGEFQITQSGVLTADTIEGGGVLLNQGRLEVGSGTISGVDLINDGTTDISSFATATIGSAITADLGTAGLIGLFQNSNLTLGGAVASSQTILFNSPQYGIGVPDEVCNLGDLTAFSGTLSGIAATDTIDFLKQDVISAFATNASLVIGLAGGTNFSLALAAPLSGVDLSLKSDSHGGTDLVFSSAGTA